MTKSQSVLSNFLNIVITYQKASHVEIVNDYFYQYFKRIRPKQKRIKKETLTEEVKSVAFVICEEAKISNAVNIIMILFMSYFQQSYFPCILPSVNELIK